MPSDRAAGPGRRRPLEARAVHADAGDESVGTVEPTLLTIVAGPPCPPRADAPLFSVFRCCVYSSLNAFITSAAFFAIHLQDRRIAAPARVARAVLLREVERHRRLPPVEAERHLQRGLIQAVGRGRRPACPRTRRRPRPRPRTARPGPCSSPGPWRPAPCAATSTPRGRLCPWWSSARRRA